MENTTSNLNLKREIEDIDNRIDELKHLVELNESLERLHENDDFKKLILDGYLGDEAERIFGLLTMPTNLKRDQLENLMDMLGSIRNLKGYFKTIIIGADNAQAQIEEEILYRQEITSQDSFENISYVIEE